MLYGDMFCYLYCLITFRHAFKSRYQDFTDILNSNQPIIVFRISVEYRYRDLKSAFNFQTRLQWSKVKSFFLESPYKVLEYRKVFMIFFFHNFIENISTRGF